MSLSISLSTPPLSVGGLSFVGGGHDGDPLSRSGGPDRPSLTRATAQRGSENITKKKPFMCQLVEKLYESNSGVCVNTGLLCMQLADGRYSGQLSVGGVTSSDSIYVIIYCCSNKNTCDGGKHKETVLRKVKI